MFSYFSAQDLNNRNTVITSDKTKIIKDSLSTPEIHQHWENVFRSEDNEKFAEKLFDRVFSKVDLPPESRFLDAGCGAGFNSFRLARRGFNVTGMDFSPAVLENAERNLEKLGFAGSVTIKEGDLLNLPFADNTFDGALAYGVLMHIPEVEKAVSELSRVVRPGGYVVVSEINLHSFEAVWVRLVRYLLKPGGNSVRTKSGLEHWVEVEGSPLVVRWTDLNWLAAAFNRQGLKLVQRLAGQFSEAYSFLPGTLLKRLVHFKNKIYFGYIRIPHFAFGNVLIFKKYK